MRFYTISENCKKLEVNIFAGFCAEKQSPALKQKPIFD